MEPPAPPQPPGDTSDPGASSSSGTGDIQPKKREITYTITPVKIKDVDDLSIGDFTLEKPSNVPHQNGCLYVLDATDLFSLRILREVNHPNILHLQCVVHSSASSIGILVESYSYGLRKEVLIDAKKLNIRRLEKLKSLIRQLIEAVDELRTRGLYHGNLNLNNTYYDKGSELLKLGNFREKEGNELGMSQFEDWDASGTMVEEITNLLKSNNPDMDFSLMEDLSRFLKNHGLTAEQVKDIALNQVYFWDKSRRTSFFVHCVVRALQNDTFRQRVDELEFISIEWNLNDHRGVLTEMNKNRVRDGKPEYTGGRVSYVQFVSGAYTHEAELKSDGQIKPEIVVDTLIPPRLCLELVRIARELGLHVC